MSDPAVQDLTEPEEEIAAEVVTYPEWAEEAEQRRAFVLECLAPLACELAAEAFIEYWFAVVAALESGEAPKPKKTKPKLETVK